LSSGRRVAFPHSKFSPSLRCFFPQLVCALHFLTGPLYSVLPILYLVLLIFFIWSLFCIVFPFLRFAGCGELISGPVGIIRITSQARPNSFVFVGLHIHRACRVDLLPFIWCPH
jgi:hypothetical protein